MKVYLLCDIDVEDKHLPECEKIEVVKKPLMPGKRGFVERVSVTRKFLKDTDSFYMDLSGYFGMQKKSVVCIHDIRAFVYDKTVDLKDFLRKQIMKNSCIHFGNKIITVSEVSKRMIAGYFHKKEDDIFVSYSGWEHLLDIKEDEGFWDDQDAIEKRGYYYALGSVMEHKNYRWIIECAKRNPRDRFVVAGKEVKNYFKDAPGNIVYMGYVTDEVNKTLMKNCKAFIQPSKYEGFGLPPLEAMAYGTDLILSDIPVFRELYDGCASFFNPDDYDFNCGAVRFPGQGKYNKCLKKYSWDYSSDVWIGIMKKVLEDN